MIFKFCFKNEIHRCSEPPANYFSLLILLKSTFKAELPKKFNLHFIDPQTEQQASLSSQKDYESLLKLNDAKTVKIYITDSEGVSDPLNSSEYDVISKTEDNIEEFKTGEVKQEKPSLETVAKDVAENLIHPQVQKLPYFSYMPMQDEHLQKMIRDIVQEQMPIIVSRVKDAVLKELKPMMVAKQEQNVQTIIPQHEERIILEQRVIDVPLEEVQKKQVRFEEYLQENGGLDNENIDMISKIDVKKEENFLDRIKKFGNVIKDRVSELPENAKNALDDWSRKIEGDPYVQIEEGKYPKSVVEKAELLKEVFIDESKKELLEFVKRYPRNVNLEQLAHLFMVKDQPQEEEHEEVVEFRQQNEAVNVQQNEGNEQRLD